MLRIKNPSDFIVDYVYTKNVADEKVVRGSVDCIIDPVDIYDGHNEYLRNKFFPTVVSYSERITVVRKKKCQNEYKYLRNLNHKNIISVFDTSDKYLYFKVYDYTLYDFFYKFITNNEITSHNSIRYITRELLKALTYLRTKKIVHRDIKMINILVNFKFKNLNSFSIHTVKLVLIDFEFAINDNSKRLLQNKPRCMTWISASPEVALKKFYSFHRTFTIDYWALGTIIFEMFFLRQCLLNNYTMRIKNLNTKISKDDIIISMYVNDLKRNKAKIEKYIEENKTKDNKNIDLQCCQFVRSLLRINPKERLGYNNIYEIISHPYMTTPTIF